MKRTVAVGIGMLVVATAAVGETGAAGAGRNWSVSAFVGGPASGPLRDMEEAMTASHFDADSPGLFVNPVEHPFSRAGNVAGWALATRRVVGPWSAGVAFGRTSLGTTVGYHQIGEPLFIDHRVDVFALIVSLNDRTVLQSFLQEDWFELTVGAGPALFMTSTENTDSSHPETSEATTFGFLFDLGLRFPPGRRFFVAGDMQYRHAGSVAVGPFTAKRDYEPYTTATVPETSVNFSHFVFGAGLGLRI